PGEPTDVPEGEEEDIPGDPTDVPEGEEEDIPDEPVDISEGEGEDILGEPVDIPEGEGEDIPGEPEDLPEGEGEDIPGDPANLPEEPENIPEGEFDYPEPDVQVSLTQEEAFDQLSDYMNKHNYGPDDYGEYSKDPEWQRLHEAAYPDSIADKPLSQGEAFDQLSDYMNKHNYGAEDYGEYSKDPEWQRLHEAAFPTENHESPQTSGLGDMPEALTPQDAQQQLQDYMNKHGYGLGDYPEYSQDPEWQRLHGAAFPNGNSGTSGGVSDMAGTQPSDMKANGDLTEARPYETIPASEISGINNTGEHFWNHHANTKDDYMDLASKLPEVQEQLANGVSLDEIKQNPDLRDCAAAYYDDDKMIQVIKTENGYEFQDDGRHRATAAQELGYDIPVKIINEDVKGKRSAVDIPTRDSKDVKYPTAEIPDDVFQTKETNPDYVNPLNRPPKSLEEMDHLDDLKNVDKQISKPWDQKNPDITD
ncbi:MAG: hypothetical protein LUG54_04195, partial [Clostridiales bacterium]|nr:hypothetical protein [Clostridiales bacterium]